MARHLILALLAVFAQPALAEPGSVPALAEPGSAPATVDSPKQIDTQTSTQIDAPVDTLTDGGRYQLMEINDRIVRLDTETGRFDLCRLEDGDWACLAAQDERVRLEETIAALTRRVAALERARQDTTRQDTAQHDIAPVAATAAPPPAGEADPARQDIPRPVSVEVTANPPASATASPVPALPVPQEILPPTNGKPIDISPAAQSEDDDGGLLSRITSLLPSLGW